MSLFAPILRSAPILLLLSTNGCDRENWDPAQLALGKTDHQTEVLRRGREQYSLYCIGCHGETGDGQGPAAAFLDPKPRDLRKARVKFAAVAAGTRPRDEDLLRTMNLGLHGTSMPAWNLLAQEDKLAIVAYIKTFSETWTKEAPGAVVPIKPDPWRKKPEQAVAEGERLYHGLAACTSCHPAYAPKKVIVEHMKAGEIPFSGFREAMYDSVTKDSDWGSPIRPPDFLIDQTKSATTKEELAVVIASGVGGTAMPSWGATLTHHQLWALAYYVESLVMKRGTSEANALKAALRQEQAQPDPPHTETTPPPTPTPAPSGSAPETH